VLLRGVNDRPEDIKALMNGLLRIGVNPYYLYQCMPVSGVSHHFQVPLKQAVDIVDDAKRDMNGYAKRFKFILGHDIGKLEICGMIENKIVLKQIHARSGHQEQASRLILHEIADGDGWVSLA
jgi:L-lysine 2,3-aminomutase